MTQLNIKNIAKVELHVHIEGATLPETYYELALKNKVKLPAKNLNQWKSFFEFKDFPHFIQVYTSAVSALKRPEDYSYLVEQFYGFQAKQNIVYSEAYLSATFLVEAFKNDEILDAISQGMKNGESKYNTKVKLIPDIARHIPESQDKVLDLVIQGYKQGLFIGIGLGGIENGFPPNLFIDSYKKAKKAGLKLVAHAGEADGPESIWGAINELGVDRIGHGVRCIEDQKLLDYLKQTQIPVEVSPTSNYHLGIVKKGETHPIRKMIDSGVFCTLNSDDPAMFSTNISQEYELLKLQGFSNDELIQLNKNAINASFLSNHEKKMLLAIT